MLFRKKMHSIILMFAVFHIFAFKGLWANKITQDKLIELVRQENPTLDQIQSRVLKAKVDLLQSLDQFNPQVETSYQHQTTNERAVIPFIPIYSPINQYNLGISKTTQQGLTLRGDISVDSRSGAADTGTQFNNIHTTIYSVTLMMDLWKDFLGSLTKKKIQSLELAKSIQESQAKVDIKVLEMNVLKNFWAHMANKEKLVVAKKLLNIAIEQLKDVKKRFQNSISDTSEVARFEAQVAARKAAILRLEYEEQVLNQGLQTLLPSLSTLLDKASFEANMQGTIDEVMECAALIRSFDKPPFQLSSLSEVMAKTKTLEQKQAQIDDRYNDIDIQLSVRAKTTGVASEGSRFVNDNATLFEGSFNASLDDMQNNNRQGLEAGIQVRIPIGAKGRDTREVMRSYQKKRFYAQVSQLEVAMQSEHRKTSKAIELLLQVIETQKINSKALQVRLKEMKKKYSQARIQALDLIQDQDTLLNTDLGIIDTQLMIIHTVLNYFQTFNKTQCALNQVEKV